MHPTVHALHGPHVTEQRHKETDLPDATLPSAVRAEEYMVDWDALKATNRPPPSTGAVTSPTEEGQWPGGIAKVDKD